MLSAPPCFEDSRGIEIEAYGAASRLGRHDNLSERIVAELTKFTIAVSQIGTELAIQLLTHSKLWSNSEYMRVSFVAFVFVLSHTVLRAQGVPEPLITVSGSVTDSVTGRGISGALVILQASPGKTELAARRAQLEQSGGAVPKAFSPAVPRRAITDENGNYTIALPETTFVSIRATHSGYLDGVTGVQGDFAQGSKLSLKLVPTSVIEGRVVNSDGEPLPGMSVEVIQAQIQDGRKVLRPLTTGRTNDLGEYRFWNITPSSVYVRVAGYQGTYFAAIPDTKESFPTIYFPAAPDQQSASMIRIPPGQTVRIDFSVSSRKSYRIRGAIKDTGPRKPFNVRLMNGDDSVENRVSINTASSEFQVYDVAPGTYTLQAYSIGPGNLALGEATVVVGEQDLTGIVVTMSTGVDVPGVIEHLGTNQAGAIQDPDSDADDPDSLADVPRGSGVIQAVILQPGRLPVTGTQPPATVDAQGHFTFKDMLPGKYAFTLYSGDEYVESILSGATDVLADGLRVGSGSPTELRVTLRRGGGSIHGAVTGLRPGEAGTVALIRTAGLAGVPTIARTAIDRTTGEAQFYTSNLAPGEYSLYAWPATQEVEFRNPEALRALSGNAAAVSLHEHGEVRVTLKAVSTEMQ